MRRFGISIVLCLTLGACTAITGRGALQSFSGDKGGTWLTPEQREFLTCGHGWRFSCSGADGRLSNAWCVCVPP